METLECDPIYIAEQVKFIRKMRGLTQENLANAAGLTTRTIEKIESGRHRPEEQTLRSLARAVHINVSFFKKLSPEHEVRQKAEMERALRKMVLVPTRPVRTASDFLSTFDERHAYRIDTSDVTQDEALEAAAAMGDLISDLNDVWNGTYMSQRLDYARSFIALCQQIEKHGYICYMGHHRQQRREKDRPILIFTVGVMAILPKEGAEGIRYALIELDGSWESLESERAAFT